MLSDYMQIRTLAVVFVGSFNPAIIQPYWLAHKKLIKEQEAKEAKVDVIHPQLAQFDLDWVSMEISPERLIFRSSKEPFFSPLRDLATGIFTFLPETPIRAAGINHLMHFAIPNETQYYQIGNQLAPLTLWEDSLRDPRMLELEIIEQKRRDGRRGHFSVRIQPSDQKLTTAFPLLISMNDHLALPDGDEGRSGEIISAVSEVWTESFARAAQTIENIWAKLKIN